MADFYLVGTGNWSSSSIWSATSGGAGGAGVPASGDTAWISANQNVTLDTDITVDEIIHTQGGLILNGYTLNSYGYSSVGSSSKTLNISNSVLHVSAANLYPNFETNDSTLTLSVAGSELIIDVAVPGAQSFSFGNKTFNDVVINLGYGSTGVEADLSGSPTFRSLLIQSKNSAAHTVNFDYNATITTSKFVGIGSSSSNRMTLVPNNFMDFYITDTCYGQFLNMSGDIELQTAIPGYIGSNSIDATGTFILQDPPKISTLVDPLTIAPGSNTNWTVSGTVTAVTSGHDGGGYQGASGASLISTDTYDLVDSELVFERPPQTPTDTSDFGIPGLGGGMSGNTGSQLSINSWIAYGASDVGYHSNYAPSDNGGNDMFTYPNSTSKYIKISYDSSTNTAAIASSPDGSSWTTAGSMVIDEPFINVFRSVRIKGAWQGNATVGSINPSLGSPESTTQSAKARVAIKKTKTQTALARIKKSVTKTQSAHARIAHNSTKTQSAIAHLVESPHSNQTAKAHIAATVIKTQTAKGTIIGLATKTQTATARIDEAYTKIQTAVARIANKFTKTQPATAHITKSVVKTQSATSRLIAHANKTQAAMAYLGAYAHTTQTATAKIVFPPPIQKHYLYKVYRSGTYLGLLPSVVSPYTHSQDINTAGSQITVSVAETADTSQFPSTLTITTEGGDTLTDESGNGLLTEGAVNIVGTGADTTLIKNGNRLEVWEYSQYHPNGIRMFKGEMEHWEAVFGSNSQDEAINILVNSDGQDMDNYMLIGSPFVSDVSQTSQDSNISIFTTGGAFTKVGQTITTGASTTNIGAIDINIAGTNALVTTKIWPDAASANSNTGLLGSITQTINNPTHAVTKFAFASPVAVASSTSYFYTVETTADSSAGVKVYYKASDIYAGGAMYVAAYGGAGGSTDYVVTPIGGVVASDLYFETYSNAGETTAVFTDADPSTGMLEPVIDNYNLQGGKVTYTSDSIDATGLSLTYQFNTSTVYSGLGTFLSLSPDGFYWYVDLGSSVLNFKNASTTPDLYITKGIEIDNLTFVATIENTKNTEYFSGGLLSGGTNLFKIYSDETSKSEFGQRLNIATDNRVTLSATANAIIQSYVNTNKDEQFQTSVTLLDSMMDITALKLGQIVGFRGLGSFIDNIQTQIVHIDYAAEEATILLGQLPPRTSITMAQITRNLIAQQTINNPSSPTS